MGLTRGERLARNIAKGKAIEKGIPSVNELHEGDSVYRDIDGVFVEYVKYGAQVFRKEYDEGIIKKQPPAPGPVTSAAGGVQEVWQNPKDGNDGHIKFDASNLTFKFGGLIDNGDAGSLWHSFQPPFDNVCLQVYMSSWGATHGQAGAHGWSKLGFYHIQAAEGVIRNYNWFAIGR